MALRHRFRMAALLHGDTENISQYSFHEPTHYRAVRGDQSQRAVRAAQDQFPILTLQFTISSPLPKESNSLGDPIGKVTRLDGRAVFSGQAMTDGTREVLNLIGQ